VTPVARVLGRDDGAGDKLRNADVYAFTEPAPHLHNEPPSAWRSERAPISPARRFTSVTCQPGVSQSLRTPAMDTTAKYLLKLPAVARMMPPDDPLFELAQAVCAGDRDICASLVSEPGFDVVALSAPLDPAEAGSGVGGGVCILHLAAIANRPEVMHVLLEAADAAIGRQVEALRVAARREAVMARSGATSGLAGTGTAGGAGGGDSAVAKQQTLDNLDRLAAMACEQQFLELLATGDSRGRTVLHYAAAAHGVMVDDGLLNFKRHRFTTAVSSDGHGTPLFPAGERCTGRTTPLPSPPPPPCSLPSRSLRRRRRVRQHGHGRAVLRRRWHRVGRGWRGVDLGGPPAAG
jgi:hypothetical protein